MRLDTAREKTITNLGGSQKFKMNASAKAFQILSSGIYERKEEAIVRELCCNAYDSHVQAGKKDVPFRIQLPTVMNDFTFAVEDFGVGLSEDEVYNVYTTYFESTKTNSNDVIGALGLGSKTPFSYTDSFMVKARKNGKECVFSAIIGETGEPEVNKMYERPWAGENGVEVSLEIASKDTHTFYNCAEKVLSWFEVKPECNKPLSYDIDSDVVDSVRQYGYHFSEGSGYGLHVDCKVLMGNVAYDLDVSDLKDGSDVDKFIEQMYRMRANIYLQIEIGEADVAASRETLSLDERTKQNLRSRIEKIRDEMKDNVLNKIASFKNIFEAKNKLSSYELSLVNSEKINGFKIGSKGVINTNIDVPRDVNDPDYLKSLNLSWIRDKYQINIYEYNYHGSSGGSRSKSTSSIIYHDIINKDYEVVVVVNDCERKSGIKQAVRDNNDLPRDVMVVMDKNTKVDADLEKLLHHICYGAYKIVYASTFWDGKLSKTKSTGYKALDKEVVRAVHMTKTMGYCTNNRIDLSKVDKSKWAFIAGDSSSVCLDTDITVKYIWLSSISWLDVSKIMKELDLDGVVAYHGNNSKKIKRILGEDRELTKLMAEKANKADVRSAIKYNLSHQYRFSKYMVFKEFETMVNNLRTTRSSQYPVCSEKILGSDNHYEYSLEEVIARRQEIFEERLTIASKKSKIVNTLLGGYAVNMRDTDLLLEVREYIKNMGV